MDEAVATAVTPWADAPFESRSSFTTPAAARLAVVDGGLPVSPLRSLVPAVGAWEIAAFPTLAALLASPEPVDAAIVVAASRGTTPTDGLRRLVQRGVPVALASPFAEQAVLAFDVGARDFLWLPTEASRVRTCLARLARSTDRAASSAGHGRAVTLVAQGDGGPRLVPASTLDYVQGDRNHVWLVAGARRWRARYRMQRLERSLGAHGFFRVHRSIVVNLARVRQVAHDRGRGVSVHLECGARVPCSRDRTAALRAALGVLR